MQDEYGASKINKMSRGIDPYLTRGGAQADSSCLLTQHCSLDRPLLTVQRLPPTQRSTLASDTCTNSLELSSVPLSLNLKSFKPSTISFFFINSIYKLFGR